MKTRCFAFCLTAACWLAAATTLPAAAKEEIKPAGPEFTAFHPLKAPAPGPLVLRAGDRLAICGDSITEQRMYSRLIEDYLTMCRPDLKISVRQFGWSGETASGFLRRMTNDCLRFQPTVATLCYGMNDYRYQPYEYAVAEAYRTNYTRVVRAFEGAGTRVVLGSPSCVGKVASWVKSARGTLQEHNLHLCTLRNIDIEIAHQEKTRFADVFWPMYCAGVEARARYGTNYAVAGDDGVHPGWSGHLMMATAFLKAMGLDGDLGTITVDLAKQRAAAIGGHTVTACANGEVTVISTRYPFCTAGDPARHTATRSATTLIPFYQDLSRLTLRVKPGKAANYSVTWGETTRVFPAKTLAKGINLAAEFPDNPFSAAFQKVDAAILKKQDFETDQIKNKFHSPAAKADMATVVAESEAQRAPLVEAVTVAFVPVTHSIKIEPQP
jgi:lysophospholipase L1-like esterase